MEPLNTSKPVLGLSLALASSLGTICLYQREQDRVTVISEHTVSETGDHSEALIKSLDEMFAKSSYQFSDLGELVTTTGPGSFTGLRISMVSLKAMAQSLEIPLLTVNGAEARAVAWCLDKNLEKESVEVATLTHLARNRRQMHLFTGSLSNSWKLESESLLEDTLPGVADYKVILADKEYSKESNFTIYPLLASHLAKAFHYCASKKAYGALSEWANVSPDYFGAKPLVPAAQKNNYRL